MSLMTSIAFCLSIAAPVDQTLVETPSLKEWFMSVDVAHSSLRILLKADEIPEDYLTPENKLNAKEYLVQINEEHPGLLQGEYDPGFDWEQYNDVLNMYNELSEMSAFERCKL